MSDFSELCPLFETGVFNEVTFDHLVNLTGITPTHNILACGPDLTSDQVSGFSFGRTVVVTEAFLRRYTATADSSNNQEMHLRLRHRASKAATPTNFGLLTVTTTGSVMTSYNYNAMTVTDTTFTSDAVLDLGIGTVTETAMGCYSLIVRYKEA
jgi:hypothetical protein